ncbi:TadE-like protein [Jatrophihabitans sp. GAS493]|uniref:TadE/TadG family type IV pilus assembly protein n=1 Tax=Jatrophihabitans sp. GAS493 TaxID=1907575 RepID=UPI000BB7ED32|nr:TadE/TadG family type IV pilus assembly protein [Jatrophihabitans sp. GAS493]SOD73772.1 TadE-like protein [Jatrophihabitans sp. GAS493]
MLRRAEHVWQSRDREQGSAVVEFSLISILLIFLLFGVLQVAVFFYLRNVVMAQASASARYAAAANIPAGAAAPRAKELIAATLGSSVANSLNCTARGAIDAPSGLQVVVVHCSGNIRSIFLPVGALLNLDVTATALKEPT